MTTSPKTFIEAQQEFYKAWYLPQLESGVSSVELDLIYYEMLGEQIQNIIAGLKEKQVELLRNMPYKAYLQTEHWQQVRQMMLEHAGKRCQLCNAGDRVLHVHHRTYENRGREMTSDLIVLCNVCHSQFHDKLELAK